MIDCMTCLVQLGQGCPTNGRTRTFHEVTHAMVTVEGSYFSGVNDAPAHGFRRSGPAGCWVFWNGAKSYWATQDQR